jgi:hypothetical protein
MSGQDATAATPKRMLIDRKLVEPERTYPTVNPATGHVDRQPQFPPQSCRLRH